MKYQRLKDIVATAIITSLVVGSLPVAFAKVSQMNIPVTYNNIKVVVDGKQLITDKEPFIYDGTTYLPVRAVGEAVGKNVGWDGVTQTVTLSSGSTSSNIAQTNNSVLYNENGIKITAQGLGEDYFGKKIKLLIENTSSKNYTVQVRDFSINGYMIDPIFSCDVVAGKKANDDITILSQYLTDNGITDIKNVELSFHIFDSDSWTEGFQSDIVSITY